MCTGLLEDLNLYGGPICSGVQQESSFLAVHQPVPQQQLGLMFVSLVEVRVQLSGGLDFLWGELIPRYQQHCAPPAQARRIFASSTDDNLSDLTTFRLAESTDAEHQALGPEVRLA